MIMSLEILMKKMTMKVIGDNKNATLRTLR